MVGGLLGDYYSSLGLIESVACQSPFDTVEEDEFRKSMQQAAERAKLKWRPSQPDTEHENINFRE